MVLNLVKLIEIRFKISHDESLSHEESDLWAKWRSTDAGKWARNFTKEDVRDYLLMVEKVKRNSLTWEELKAKMGITFSPPSKL